MWISWPHTQTTYQNSLCPLERCSNFLQNLPCPTTQTPKMESLPIAIGNSSFLLPTRRKTKSLPFKTIYSNPLSSLLRRPFSPSSNSHHHFGSRSIPVRALGLHTHHDHDHHDNHHHGNHKHHDHDHHHHHNHHHHDSEDLTKAQEAVMRFARATRWAELSDFLREHLVLCCCSAACLLIAGVCPYLLSKTVAKPLQTALIVVAFPLVGVCFFFLPLVFELESWIISDM